MRFTVVTYGSEGDTRPLVGLCRGLMDAGYEVSLFADCSTLSSAQEQGVPTVALAGDMKGATGSSGALAKIMKGGGDVTQVAKAAARIANENMSYWMQAVVEDASHSDAILFSGLASYVGLSVGEYLDVPAIGLGLWPVSPTKEFPSPLLSPLRLPGRLNLLTHYGVNELLWLLFRKKLNEARRDICGQMPRRRKWREYPVLYGISPQLVPRPSDWLDIWKMCGAWHVTAREWVPPPELGKFLSNGAPPIYIGFGSMSGFDRQRVVSTVIEAAAGRRALFYPGWSGIEPEWLPENFFAIGQTPHDWLFQKVSMVIHHGGAGTSHMAARAGVPSVVVPFAADQFFWADRLERLGVAPKYVSHTHLNVRALTTMIDFAESDSARKKANQLGIAMRLENGINRAIAHLEELMSN